MKKFFSFNGICRFLLISIIASINIYSNNAVRVLDPQIGNSSKRVGSIDNVTAIVTPYGLYSKIDYFMEFSAKGTSYKSEFDTLEVEYFFDLPAEAAVVDSWLWVGNEIVKAKLIEKGKASLIYEGIVKRRQDPSILTKESATQYQLRIFPMPATETRRVMISVIVQNIFVGNNITSYMPINLLKVGNENTTNATNPITIININNIDLINFTIPELSSLQSNVVNIPNYGEGLSYNISRSALQNLNTLSISNDLVKQNNIFFSYLPSVTDQGEFYYQLSFNSSLYTKDLPGKKFLFILDYNESNTTNVAKNMLTPGIKQLLQTNLNSNDSFNIISSSLIEPINWYNNFLPNIKQNQDKVTDSIGNANIKSFGNLTSTLVNTINYVKNIKDNDVHIILISNSEEYANLNTSNDLIVELEKSITPNMHFSVLDLSHYTNNSKYISTNQGKYYGNQYFYYMMSGRNKGAYIQAGNNMNTSINTLLNNTLGTTENLETFTTVTSGAAFSKYKKSILSNQFMEFGKFKGQLPFNIQISGLYRNNPINANIIITEEMVSKLNQRNKQIWSINEILKNESLNNNSSFNAQRIIERSMQERVLSLYTAFLALDPALEPGNNGNNQNGNGNGNNGGGNTDIIDIPTESQTLKLEVFPNPFSSIVNIKFIEGMASNGEPMELSIVDTWGRVIKTFSSEALLGGGTLTWDGTDEHGSPMPSGVYVLLVKTSKGSFTAHIELVK